MATFTENYTLAKPEETDPYDVAVFNENFDTIDEAVALIETAAASIDQKIGEPEGSETIFQLLKRSAGAMVYTPAETPRKTTGSVTSPGTVNRFKATSFTAAHSGTICVVLNYSYTSGTTTPSFNVYDRFAKEYLEMADGTNTKEAGYPKDSTITTFSLGSKSGPLRLLLPVVQGKCYYFEIYHGAATGFVLESCQLCFDVISADDITPFN